MFGNQPTTLKYKKRAGIYSNSTGSCEYYPEEETAYSYSWWRFVERINGELIFNDYRYSRPTGHHQDAVRSLLRSMNKKYRIVEAPRGLGRLQESWRHYFKLACELEVEMSKPRSLERKNFERLCSDGSWHYSFNELHYLMAELESIGCKPLSEKEQKKIRDKYFQREKERINFLKRQKENLNNSLNESIENVLNQGAM